MKTATSFPTGLTVLPESKMVPDDSIYETAILSGGTLDRVDAAVRGRLALMRALHSSLCAGHTALVELNLQGIECGTQEQVVLSRKLAEDVRQENPSPAGPRSGQYRSAGFAGCTPRLAEELRQSEREVLQGLRLQAALLARAQSKLRVLANMMADPGIDYGPLLERGLFEQRTFEPRSPERRSFERRSFERRSSERRQGRTGSLPDVGSVKRRGEI
jgi:hypothetical protein